MRSRRRNLRPERQDLRRRQYRLPRLQRTQQWWIGLLEADCQPRQACPQSRCRHSERVGDARQHLGQVVPERPWPAHFFQRDELEINAVIRHKAELTVTRILDGKDALRTHARLHQQDPLTPDPSPPRGEGSTLSPLAPGGRGVGGEGRSKAAQLGTVGIGWAA